MIADKLNLSQVTSMSEDEARKNPLKDIQDNLDYVVRKAYGMTLNDDILEYLFWLNQDISNKESNGVTVLAPGLPPFITDRASFLSDDCVQMTKS
jgi:hypothetical protein